MSAMNSQSPDAASLRTAWTDVHLETKPFQTLCFRTGMAVCEESLIRGQWVGRSWNGAGYINPWENVRLDLATHPAPQAFWLELDGQLLASHWGWAGRTAACSR